MSKGIHEILRDAMSRGESVKVVEFGAGDKALVRTLEAHEIAVATQHDTNPDTTSVTRIR